MTWYMEGSLARTTKELLRTISHEGFLVNLPLDDRGSLSRWLAKRDVSESSWKDFGQLLTVLEPSLGDIFPRRSKESAAGADAVPIIIEESGEEYSSRIGDYIEQMREWFCTGVPGSGKYVQDWYGPMHGRYNKYKRAGGEGSCDQEGGARVCFCRAVTRA